MTAGRRQTACFLSWERSRFALFTLLVGCATGAHDADSDAGASGTGGAGGAVDTSSDSSAADPGTSGRAPGVGGSSSDTGKTSPDAGGDSPDAGGGSPDAGGTATGSDGQTRDGSSGNVDPADCMGPTPGTSGSNPLFTEIFTADPAVLVHDCTFYITAGHDEGTNGFVLRDWYVLSSKDMVHWSYNEGPVLSLDTFEWANANAWASQMVERDGKFYWYVPVHEAGGAMAIGVAVADTPLGPFTDAIGGPLINDRTEMEAFGYDDPGQTAYTIDPTVLVDDDGQAYLIYGSFWRMVAVRLGDDMISLEGEMVEETPPDFFEAPYLVKRHDTYYVVYAAGANPATIDYATSDSPMGPWERRGTILDALPNNPGEDAATSHPAVAELAGQWYLVYHLSDGPGGGTYRRQVAIDKLTFNEDGTIQPVTPSDGLEF